MDVKEKNKIKEKSSRATQKSPGDKLKNETTSREAMHKKFRYGKKDNRSSKDEMKAKEKLQRQGRKRAYAEVALVSGVRREIVRNEDENVGVDALNAGLDTIETGVSKVSGSRYSGKIHERKYKRQIEEEKSLKGASKDGSNARSKAMQKIRMKKEMTEAAQKKQTKETANSFGSLSKNFVDQAENLAGKLAEFIKKHPKEILIAAMTMLILLVVVTCFSSCSVMLSGVTNATVESSYTAKDQIILQVNEDYTELEEALKQRIDNIENTYPGYDEYRYHLSEINHNPYQLAAVLTVFYEDYSRSEVQSMLQTLFDSQYNLTVQRIVERKSREEIRTGERTVHHEDGTTSTETYSYTVTVYYDYYILDTTLTNATMDTVIRNLGLTEDQLNRYELLLATYGNKRYLFEDDIYSIVEPGDYQDYEIPPEALTDTKFANMIREAEKYLGYPYVWGGSSPSTSFDCSGFVSYVINNCGNGWSMGRQTANGLLSHCTRVSTSEARPGDLIFFQGTYAVRGASHVGIYVGNGMMIHCGNPIQYTSINTNYWQSHFYTYGRIN